MNNHITAMLSAWHGARDETDWVLGTVFKTEGSAYRKAGALSILAECHQLLFGRNRAASRRSAPQMAAAQ